MDDELAIDRYALNWLPGEVALIARWVQETSELWLGWASHATDEESNTSGPGSTSWSSSSVKSSRMRVPKPDASGHP